MAAIAFLASAVPFGGKKGKKKNNNKRGVKRQ